MQFSKKLSTALLAIAISVAAAATLMFGLTFSAFAASASEEAPYIYCTYTDAEGNQVCGDNLTAGTYDVSFYTENVDKISAIEITSTYDASVVTIEGVKNPSSSLTSMGSVTANGNLVIGYVSDNNYAQVNPEGELISTVSMTFAQDCDAEAYITVSENPNLTFIVADSTNDNYDDEYALVESYEGYTGSLSQMTYNLTPPLTGEGIRISGRVTIANSANGADSGFGLRSVQIVANPVVDSYGRIIGGEVITTTATDGDRASYGNFDITVPAGTTAIGITGESLVDRVVQLGDNKVIENAVIPVAICDYNRDTLVNSTDLAAFLSHYSGDYNINADYNADNLVNSTDLATFLSQYNSGVSYDDLTLN